MTNNSFDLCDEMAAKEVFSRWQAQNSEDIDEYIMRQRQSELNELVRLVIKNELSERDRLLVRLHWYKGLSKDKIAEITGAGRSTVYRRLDKINDIIYDKLKYAIEYRYAGRGEKAAKVLVRMKADCPTDRGSLNEIGRRLYFLRIGQVLTPEDMERLTGISKKRLAELESNGADATMIEIKKLAAFFRVSSDYIIFGARRTLRDPLTGMPREVNCLTGGEKNIDL